MQCKMSSLIKIMYILLVLWSNNSINGVMVSVLALSAVDRVLEPGSGQTKGVDFKIGTCICCFSAEQAALRIKCKD